MVSVGTFKWIFQEHPEVVLVHLEPLGTERECRLPFTYLQGRYYIFMLVESLLRVLIISEDLMVAVVLHQAKVRQVGVEHLIFE
jgi:hypothetical protein